MGSLLQSSSKAHTIQAQILTKKDYGTSQNIGSLVKREKEMLCIIVVGIDARDTYIDLDIGLGCNDKRIKLQGGISSETLVLD